MSETASLWQHHQVPQRNSQERSVTINYRNARLSLQSHVFSQSCDSCHVFSLASHVSTHLLIHLSAHLYYHHHTTLIIHHSFTLSLQAQNLPFQQILPTLDFFYLPDCLHDNGTGPDLSCSSFYF